MAGWLQDVLAFALVVAASVWLARRWWLARRLRGCSSCPSAPTPRRRKGPGTGVRARGLNILP